MRKVVTSFLPGLALFAIVVAALRIGFEPMPAQAQQPPATGGCITFAANGVASNNCPYLLQRYTVATLPACGTSTKGLLAWVSDAQSPTYGGALTGGGSTPALAFCGGATWNAH